MSEFKLDAIVINSAEYRDNDKMLTLFSPSHGKISAIARGCRKLNSKLRSSSEYFAFGEFIIREKNNRLSIVQSSLKESFYSLRSNYKAFNVAFSILDSLNAVLQENQESEDLFKIVYNILSFLSYSQLNADDLWIVYLVKILKNQGFEPSTIKCSICGESTFTSPSFSPSLGAICSNCSAKHSGEPVQALTLEALRRLLDLDISDLEKVKIPDVQRNELLMIIPNYYLEHIGGNYRTVLLKPQH